MGLAALVSVIVAIVYGVLATVDGASIASAISQGGAAFAVALTLGLAALSALGVV